MTTVIADLQQAVAAYAHALDELDVAGLEAVLTRDTSWTFTMPGKGVLGPVAGREAVLDFVRAGHASQTGRVRHHLVNVVATVSGADTAVVRAYLLHTRTTGDAPRLISTGAYTFGLRRAGGAWRIAELTLALDNDL